MIMKGKRANITLEGHDIIMTRALEHPRLKRTSLAEKIQTELKSKGYDTPEIEVLERKISWWRNHDEDDPQGKPLSMVILAQPQPPIPPEAMPAVLRVWNWRVSCDEPFSIREAKWVSRLYTIFDPVNDQQTLMDWASGLAHREILCNMSKIPFTTHDLDTLLTEPDNSKIIQDAKMGRLKIYRSKPTIRDLISKAKRTPSTWPAGVKPEFTEISKWGEVESDEESTEASED